MNEKTDAITKQIACTGVMRLNIILCLLVTTCKKKLFMRRALSATQPAEYGASTSLHPKNIYSNVFHSSELH